MKKKSFLIFLVSLIILGGIFYYGYTILNAFQATVDDSISGTDLGSGNTIEQKVPGEIMFLMAGIDENSDEEAKDSMARTDTLMLVKANYNDGEVNIISIPRDTRVKINGQIHKMNSAHAYGGMPLTIKTIRTMLGIDLDYYMAVDFDAVKGIIDAIGGVEVTSPHRIEIPEINIDIPEGKTKLNGEEALEFVRHRNGFSNGDLGRVENQQNFLRDLAKQLLSPKNIFKLPKLAKVYEKNVVTNIPGSTMKEFLMHAYKFSPDNIKTQTLPGRPTTWKESAISYYVLNKKATLELVDEVFSRYKVTEY